MSSEKLEFQIPVLRIMQREEKNQALYVGKIKVENLFYRGEERFKIDYWRRKPKEDGYQRPLSKQAVDKVVNFILKETPNPLLPSALLVNCRQTLDFKEIKDSFGLLDIKDTLYIIDGQHRFEAWKEIMKTPELSMEWGSYEMPIVILSGFEKIKEIEQFFVINSRQKRIKTGLAQRNFIGLAGNEATSRLVPMSARWQIYATKLVDRLNEEIEGVWQGQIILPDDDKTLRKSKIITQESFVSSLKPLFVGKSATWDRVQDRPRFLEEAGVFLARFWDIVSKTYPNATKNYNDYSLMKTVGVFSLHMFLSDVLNKNNADEEKTLIEVEDLLRESSETSFPEDFWRSKVPYKTKEEGNYAGAFSSSTGHKIISIGLRVGERIGH